jgi:hypothetical protein
VPFRGLFIIDPKQKLRQITINDLPVGRSASLNPVTSVVEPEPHGSAPVSQRYREDIPHFSTAGFMNSSGAVFRSDPRLSVKALKLQNLLQIFKVKIYF